MYSIAPSIVQERRGEEGDRRYGKMTAQSGQVILVRSLIGREPVD